MPANLFHPRSFVDAIAKQPTQLFWTFALLHLALWTFIPTLTAPNVPLDVIEGYAWGHEWPLGTYKHPPFQAWVLEILAVLTNRAPWAHYLASQIAIIVTFWAVWKTGLRMMSEKAALVGVLMLEGVIYYNYTSTEFNPNVLQLPFWALIGYTFHKAVKDNRLTDWLLLGLWSAGGLYSKYSTTLLLITLTCFMLYYPETRRRLRCSGPYLTVLTTLAIFAPHLMWLYNHDFQPFTYATAQLTQIELPRHSVSSYVLSPVFLISGQFVALLAFVVLFLGFYSHKSPMTGDQPDKLDKAFLQAIALGPFAMTFLLSIALGFRVHDMWGTPFWNFIGLWVLARFRPSLSEEALTRFISIWGIIFAAGLLIYMGTNILYPYVTSKTQRINFPGRDLSQHVTSYWHERFHTPLRYAIGDTWTAGNVAYYAHERPHVFIFGDKTISPWIKSQDFADRGGVIVWCVLHCLGLQEQGGDKPPDFVLQRFPQAELQEPFSLSRMTEADVQPVKIGWAVIPPSGSGTSTK